MDAKSQGAVVQLVRMPACHAGGRGFESLPHRKNASHDCEGHLFLLLPTSECIWDQVQTKDDPWSPWDTEVIRIDI